MFIFQVFPIFLSFNLLNRSMDGTVGIGFMIPTDIDLQPEAQLANTNIIYIL